MQLSDRELRDLLPELNFQTPEYAPPFDPAQQIQPASIDLRVDRVHWRRQRVSLPIDLTNKFSTSLRSGRHSYKSDLGARGKYRLRPGEIVMTRTLEEFSVPPGYSAQIFTRSSFGRLGLSVTCAAFINPGYRGHMPLQILNLGRDTIFFQPLISVCQLVLVRLSSEPERTYGDIDLRSKYADDDGGPSRWWMDRIIQQNQDSLGSTNMPAEAQTKLLKLILSRDISTQLRFEHFLKHSRSSDLENADSAIDAFALTERRAMITARVLNGVGAFVLLLIAASIGALFSTPFNETKYGLPHVILWAVTILATAGYVPVAYHKLSARETDFILPEDLTSERSRVSEVS